MTNQAASSHPYTSPDILAIINGRADSQAEGEIPGRLTDEQRGVEYAGATWARCFHSGPNRGRPLAWILAAYRDRIAGSLAGKSVDFQRTAEARFRQLVQAWVGRQPDADQLERFFGEEFSRLNPEARPV